MRNWKGYFVAWLFGLALIATIANAWAIGAWSQAGYVYADVFQMVFYALAPIWTVIVAILAILALLRYRVVCLATYVTSLQKARSLPLS